MTRRTVPQFVLVGMVLGLMNLSQALAQTKAPAADKPASNLEIIHEKLKADKKLTVAKYMELTESEKAKNLLDQWIALEQEEGKRRSAFAPKVLAALPAKKAARYLQIENEFRIMLRYDLAATVPLVQ
jgi:hypothetical protein